MNSNETNGTSGNDRNRRVGAPIMTTDVHRGLFPVYLGLRLSLDQAAMKEAPRTNPNDEAQTMTKAIRIRSCAIVTPAIARATYKRNTPRIVAATENTEIASSRKMVFTARPRSTYSDTLLMPRALSRRAGVVAGNSRGRRGLARRMVRLVEGLTSVIGAYSLARP